MEVLHAVLANVPPVPQSWYAVFMPPVCYSLLVGFLKRHDEHQLRGVLRLRFYHNVTMAVYSGIVAWLAMAKLLHFHRFDSVHSLLCEASPGQLPFWWHSKMAEWADTIFLIAAGKTLSNLHLKHHCVTASLVALNIVGRRNPTPLSDVASGLNAGVHVLMYMYFVNPVFFYPTIKQLITGLQLLQHLLVVSAILYALDADDCDAPEFAYLPSLFLYFIWCCEFGTLYRKNYMGVLKKAKAK